MALTHASSGQALNLQPLGPDLHRAQSSALVKARDLELVRLVLPQGKTLPAHSVPGDITLLCLEGVVEVQAGGVSRLLETGQLMYLAGGVSHALRALIDASLLLTIALRR